MGEHAMSNLPFRANHPLNRQDMQALKRIAARNNEVYIAVPQEQMDELRAVAKSQGLSAIEWVVGVLNREFEKAKKEK